jgi:hypothetical protein
MTTEIKTPLQAVVGVICDMLCELPPDDQARAVEAVCLTLGLRTPRLPAVQVEMMSNRPVVTSPPIDRPGRALVAVGSQQQRFPRLTQNRPESGRAVSAQRGYVRSIR